MATNLTRGAYSGKETYLYYNSATHETPTWVEIPRSRNIQITDGPALADVEFHGAKSTSQIPGYSQFNGSLEYVMKKGDDAVYDALKVASENGDILELNGPLSVDGSKGWRAPCLLGEFAVNSNGGDPVVATIPVSKADAYDASGNAVEKIRVTASGGTVPNT
jgi:hypothetical protein